MRIVIWTACYHEPHMRAFDEMSLSLASAFRSLGHEAVEEKGTIPGVADHVIVLGAHRLPGTELSDRCIIYNAEQISEKMEGSHYLRLLRTHVVWDYSNLNLERLRRLGCTRLALCRPGYVPELSRIEPREKDIDVLHYGSLNPRRKETLDALTAAGLEVKHLFGVYGAERDAWIARSKVVLNLHYYDPAIFEIFRVSYLLMNRACVLTETGGVDLELEDFASMTCWRAPREHLVKACKALVEDGARREEMAKNGFEMFSTAMKSQAYWVEHAMEETVSMQVSAVDSTETVKDEVCVIPLTEALTYDRARWTSDDQADLDRIVDGINEAIRERFDGAATVYRAMCTNNKAALAASRLCGEAGWNVIMNPFMGTSMISNQNTVAGYTYQLMLKDDPVRMATMMVRSLSSEERKTLLKEFA
jgi:hypothetical protein